MVNAMADDRVKSIDDLAVGDIVTAVECNACGEVVNYVKAINAEGAPYALAACRCGVSHVYQDSGRTIDVSGLHVASNVVTQLGDANP